MLKPFNVRGFFILLFTVYFLISGQTWCEEPAFNNQEEALLFTIQNPNTFLEKRIDALQEYSKRFPDQAGPLLIELLKNPKESRILQNAAAEAMSTIPNPSQILNSLEEIAGNRKMERAIRERALFALWKMNPERALEIIGIVSGDAYEEPNFRLTAFSYIRVNPKHAEHQKIALEIFQNKSEVAELRQQAFELLQSGKTAEEKRKFYQLILMDVGENENMRKIALRESAALKSPNLMDDALKIISNSKENKALQEFAFQYLASQKLKLDPMLPQLKKTFLILPQGSLKVSMKKLIGEIQKIRDGSRINDSKQRI